MKSKPVVDTEDSRNDLAQFRLQLYKKRASDRGFAFEIPYDTFKAMLFAPCFYCGAQAATGTKNSRSGIRSHGVDRIDNTKGYTLDNVCTACVLCNYAKSDEPLESWLSRMRTIVERTKHLPCPAVTEWQSRVDLQTQRGKAATRTIHAVYTERNYYKRRNYE